MRTVHLLVRLSRPWFLLGGVLVYALGAGIARYLGAQINWQVLLLGQLWVTLLQLSGQYLNEYFDASQDLDNPNRTLFSGGSGALGPGGLPRRTALMAAMGCLAVVASLTVLIISSANPQPSIVLIMVLGLLGAIFYSVPPLRLETSGYGELTTSLLVANLVPAFAFILQWGDFHRLLAMSTFPLTFLHLAMMLAFELPDYAVDIKHDKRTLMIRLGWDRGMTLHNLLILGSYLVLALAVWSGLPVRIALPVFFTLPLGFLQIWQMRRIADGAAPNWTAITLTPVALFAAVTYLLAFSFWTR